MASWGVFRKHMIYNVSIFFIKNSFSIQGLHNMYHITYNNGNYMLYLFWWLETQVNGDTCITSVRIQSGGEKKYFMF